MLVIASILLVASRQNGASAFKESVALYRVDTKAIEKRVREEFAAKIKDGKQTKPVRKGKNAA